MCVERSEWWILCVCSWNLISFIKFHKVLISSKYDRKKWKIYFTLLLRLYHVQSDRTISNWVLPKSSIQLHNIHTCIYEIHISRRLYILAHIKYICFNGPMHHRCPSYMASFMTCILTVVMFMILKTSWKSEHFWI